MTLCLRQWFCGRDRPIGLPEALSQNTRLGNVLGALVIYQRHRVEVTR